MKVLRHIGEFCNYLLFLVIGKIAFLSLIVFLFVACGNDRKTDDALIQKTSKQLSYLVEATNDSLKVPRSWNEKDGHSMVGNRDWCCGFSAGSFWYMHELTNDAYWKDVAIRNTEKLAGMEYYTHTHDLGFMVYCSYGNAFRITKDPKYRDVVLQALESLISRFNPVVGCIRSWNSGTWQFPVIIDNMMNLEMLFWAFHQTGDDRFRNVVITHANTTMKNHFRDDMSSYHVVDYDTITGNVIKKQTHQGFGDETAWARGQAWGLYGFTLCYRETKDPQFFNVAEKIASYIIGNLPDDFIPFWDFHDPAIPDAKHDASAAAIVASAFYELAGYSEKRDEYISVADKIIEKLTSDIYLAENGTNGGFLLRHSVGNYPQNSEIDVPINYADYYFLEGIKNRKELKK